jgi:hypothetical protein
LLLDNASKTNQMLSSPDQLRFGYWPHRQLSGEIPSPIRAVNEYAGTGVLNVACTQTGLAASQQRLLVQQWIDVLPSVPATTIVFSSKVSQELFDAACKAPNLEALSIKWSSVKILEALSQAKTLQALFLGSSPGVSDLQPIARLRDLKYLFLENVLDPVDLAFMKELGELKEFGLSATRGRRMKVLTLQPIASATNLEMMWLIDLQVMQDGLRPLHSLPRLKSLRSTLKPASPEFDELRRAVPSLQYFQPVG